MTRLRRIQLITVTLVVAAAIGVFFVIVPTIGTNTDPIGNTIIASPSVVGLSGFNDAPAFTGDLPTGQLQIPSMVAGNEDPVRTGAWAKQWFGSNIHSTNNLQLLTDIAPNVTAAKASEITIKSNASSEASIKSANHVFGKNFSVAPLEGGGITYTIPAVHKPKTATTAAVNAPAQPGVAIVYRVDRTVVQETLSGTAGTVKNALAIANAEAATVTKVVPTLPPFQIKHDPRGAVILYVVLALVIMVIAAFIPVGIDAGKRRREAEIVARADRHRRVRGAKALKSQRRRF